MCLYLSTVQGKGGGLNRKNLLLHVVRIPNKNMSRHPIAVWLVLLGGGGRKGLICSPFSLLTPASNPVCSAVSPLLSGCGTQCVAILKCLNHQPDRGDNSMETEAYQVFV
jgi:hypothetical protein